MLVTFIVIVITQYLRKLLEEFTFAYSLRVKSIREGNGAHNNNMRSWTPQHLQKTEIDEGQGSKRYECFFFSLEFRTLAGGMVPPTHEVDLSSSINLT